MIFLRCKPCTCFIIFALADIARDPLNSMIGEGTSLAQAIYRGFSTANWLKTKSFSLTNIDLVKQDLLNHIWTIVGSRVCMPNFGTRIPTLTFEPNDASTIAIIEEDLTAVFNYDPRVKLLSLNVSSLPNNNAIIAVANLLYVELNVTGVLNIEIPTS